MMGTVIRKDHKEYQEQLYSVNEGLPKPVGIGPNQVLELSYPPSSIYVLLSPSSPSSLHLTMSRYWSSLVVFPPLHLPSFPYLLCPGRPLPRNPRYLVLLPRGPTRPAVCLGARAPRLINNDSWPRHNASSWEDPWAAFHAFGAPYPSIPQKRDPQRNARMVHTLAITSGFRKDPEVTFSAIPETLAIPPLPPHEMHNRMFKRNRFATQIVRLCPSG
ncbi:hypothetical protein CEXT_671891 [Caerostris extrusa]|uniref:Uncharacterized protein n=1 Tax=Caerostris extrusa TaxID=172846 RepID=A0AAV4RYT0_CAEEX|nr:hypothetical protein CEXT_671891 [Caerostris extrusa]